MTGRPLLGALRTLRAEWGRGNLAGHPSQDSVGGGTKGAEWSECRSIYRNQGPKTWLGNVGVFKQRRPESPAQKTVSSSSRNLKKKEAVVMGSNFRAHYHVSRLFCGMNFCQVT